MAASRIVVDTNTFISHLLLPDSTTNKAVGKALRTGIILVSNDTLEELASVLAREKFNRYISIEQREEFLRKLIRITEKVAITKRIQACRDPDDDKFLELAINGTADFIITGDRDLLTLSPFHKVEILSPSKYLKL